MFILDGIESRSKVYWDDEIIGVLIVCYQHVIETKIMTLSTRYIGGDGWTT